VGRIFFPYFSKKLLPVMKKIKDDIFLNAPASDSTNLWINFWYPMAVSGWLSMAKWSLFYMFYKGNNNIFVVQEFKSKFKILNLN